MTDHSLLQNSNMLYATLQQRISGRKADDPSTHNNDMVLIHALLCLLIHKTTILSITEITFIFQYKRQISRKSFIIICVTLLSHVQHLCKHLCNDCNKTDADVLQSCWSSEYRTRILDAKRNIPYNSI